MESRILSKIRRLNWVLSESTTGSLSYNDLSVILKEIIDANVYIADIDGNMLGVSYINAEDSSTVLGEGGTERLEVIHNQNFLSIEETAANLRGEEILRFVGEDYEMADKYHCIIPSVCGGQRMGTLIAARHGEKFDDVDIALCEYGATVVGLEIKRNMNLAAEREKALRKAVDIAIETLSFSEREALGKIMQEFSGDQGSLVASKVAAKYSLTNSVIVNALRKLESAGVLQARSLGVKGTRINITNPYLREKAEALSL